MSNFITPSDCTSGLDFSFFAHNIKRSDFKVVSGEVVKKKEVEQWINRVLLF